MSASRPPRPSAPRLAVRRHTSAPTEAQRVFGDEDASLLDIVDNVLNKGVVVTGDITIALAQVDLIYARLSLLLCAADRVLPAQDREQPSRHRARRARRTLVSRRA